MLSSISCLDNSDDDGVKVQNSDNVFVTHYSEVVICEHRILEPDGSGIEDGVLFLVLGVEGTEQLVVSTCTVGVI